MTQAEVVSILATHAHIEPSFTTLVWDKLVEQNQGFFTCVHASPGGRAPAVRVAG